VAGTGHAVVAWLCRTGSKTGRFGRPCGLSRLYPPDLLPAPSTVAATVAEERPHDRSLACSRV